VRSTLARPLIRHPQPPVPPEQFLETPAAGGAASTVDMPLPYVAQLSQPTPQRVKPKAHAAAVTQVRRDAVYVDCFFYGFWLPQNKLPAFQVSALRPVRLGTDSPILAITTLTWSCARIVLPVPTGELADRRFVMPSWHAECKLLPSTEHASAMANGGQEYVSSTCAIDSVQ